jgi:hypothetical protein
MVEMAVMATWVLELLGAMTFLETATRRGRAADDNNKNRLLKVLFFSKSSGFEHGVVKRTGEGQSLSEAHSQSLGGHTASISSLRRMGACSIAICLSTMHSSFSRPGI